jgi:hypothetical protein
MDDSDCPVCDAFTRIAQLARTFRASTMPVGPALTAELLREIAEIADQTLAFVEPASSGDVDADIAAE